jgi:hypothetical protein
MNNLTDRHGGPEDRGRADAYYGRAACPHYYVGGTYDTPEVPASQMTAEEIAAYHYGYNNEHDRKDWGYDDDEP